MKTFDLELRVKTFGSIITWKVLLEDSTNDNNRVLDWLQGDEYRFKMLPGYKIQDNPLEDIASCHGIAGKQITCEVVIDEKSRDNKVVVRSEDREYVTQSYEINELV